MQRIVINLILSLLDKPAKLKIIQNFTLHYGNMIFFLFYDHWKTGIIHS